MLAHVLALLTAATTLLLIVFGGLVTNTGAALAVPDWPTTFGHSMFLFPWSGMVGGIFYEHGHRLIGSVVGLLTVGLGLALWPLGGRLRWLGLVAVMGVIVQGVLGGLRVVLLEGLLAIVHGCLAQAFFALVVALAYLTSRAAAGPPGGLSGLGGITTSTAGVVYLHVVTGALLTHLGRLEAHLLTAVAVYAIVPIATARLRRSGDPVGARVGRVLLALLGVQLFLGLGATVARFTSVELPAHAVTGLAMPVTHRLAGALVLAAAVVAAIRATVAPAVPVRGLGPAPLAAPGRAR